MAKRAARLATNISSDRGGVRYAFAGSRWLSSEQSAAISGREDARREIRPSAAMTKPVKRLLDIAGAVCGIVLFGPLMLVIAALVKQEGGDAIFAHQRIGLNGKPFHCLKFRTMVPDAKERLATLLDSDPEARREWEQERKLRNDPRITPLGAFLRKTSLDELPQFFNVLKGDMSLVGPRPITAEERPLYGDSFALYAACRPGITGVWQVSGRNDISYPVRVALDAQYALNQSIAFDCVILLKTFGVVASRSGAR